MYIEGPLKSGKTSFLAEKFIELVNSGVSTSEILVVVLNSYKKKIFAEKIREKLHEAGVFSIGELPVFTFNGIVYNSIKSHWALVEELIPENIGKREIIPNLCGLEISELLIKSCIKKINKRENLDESLRDYQSYQNLKHQLLRRLTLITNNFLDKSEIAQRSAVLDEQMGKQAQDVLEELKLITRNYRTFDYLKQIPTFLYLLDKDKINFSGIKYLLVDDFDEMTYSAHHFVKKLLCSVKDFYIAVDPQGSSRRGYLCADPFGYERIKALKPSETLEMSSDKEIYDDAQELFEAIININNKLPKLRNISILENSIRHVEMLEQVFCKIKVLLNNEKYSPDDIVLVTPSLDGILKHAIKEFFEKENINYQFLTGSRKIFDDSQVFGTLIILQLINNKWGFKPKLFEIRSLLTGMVAIPTVLCEEILDRYKETGSFDENIRLDSNDANEKYQNLIRVINTLKEDLKEEKMPLSSVVERLYLELILPNLNEDSEKYNLEDFNRMTESLLAFEKLVSKTDKADNRIFLEKEWLILIKDTIVSDNPSHAQEINPNSIKIATPQKIIDLELESKIQIWLDISSLSWMKDDTGPLYNAWVFHKNWQEEKYTPQIHKKLTLEKTAHVLRKLILLSNQRIYCLIN